MEVTLCVSDPGHILIQSWAFGKGKGRPRNGTSDTETWLVVHFLTEQTFIKIIMSQLSLGLLLTETKAVIVEGEKAILQGLRSAERLMLSDRCHCDNWSPGGGLCSKSPTDPEVQQDLGSCPLSEGPTQSLSAAQPPGEWA